MKPFIRSTIRCSLAAVVPGLMAAGLVASAQAQSPADACVVAAPEQTGPAAVLGLNQCIGDIAEGLAPVWLPAAEVPIDDVAGMRDGHRWGFLDEQGALRIAPRFAQVGRFSHGLAAASDGQSWGYIGTDGQWVIQPGFERAEPFSAAGMALVRRHGRWALIDGQGVVLRELDAAVRQASLVGATPARLALDYETRHMSLDGEPIQVPQGVQLIEPFGTDGLYIAQQGTRQGILQSNGVWRVEPQFTAIQTWSGQASVGFAVAHERPGAVRLIQPDGDLLEAVFEAAGLLSARFGVAVDADGRAHVFTLDGVPVLSLPAADLSSARVRELGDFVIWTPEKGPMQVLSPANGQVLKVPAGLQPQQVQGPVLLFAAAADGPVRALLTDQGVFIDARQGAPWLSEVAGAQRRQAHIWLSDAAGNWINVLSPEGKPLLGAVARKALVQGRWQPLGGAAQMPLALSRTPQCGCEADGAGLIDAQGRVVANAAWRTLTPADDGELPAGLAPRFVVTTAQGAGLIDAEGRALGAADLKHIGTFRGGYALAYGDAGLLALDREGGRHALPDVFRAEPIGEGWFRFLETALVDAQWGIYDVAQGRVIQPPSFAQVGERHGGYTRAAVRVEGGLRWGLLDAQGGWRLQPEFDVLEPLPEGEWRVQLPGARGQTRVGVVRADGSWLIEPTEGLEIEMLQGGGWVAHAGTRSWMHQAGSQVLASANGERFIHRGDWFAIERRAQAGYVDGQGQWLLGPYAVDLASPFAGTRRVALLVRERTAWLIDETGRKVADLPSGAGWTWPEGADGPYRVGTVDGGRHITQYASAQGGAVRIIDGVGGPARTGRLAVQTAPGRLRVLDEAGKESPTWLFDTLIPAGPDAPALAGAQAHYGYVDGAGRYVVPPVYAAAQSFASGRAVVSTPQLSLLIDAAGRPLARVESQCGIRVLYGAGGIRVWPEQMPVRCQRQP